MFNDVVYTASVKLPGYRKSEKSQVGKLGIIAHCILGFGVCLHCTLGCCGGFLKSWYSNDVGGSSLTF